MAVKKAAKEMFFKSAYKKYAKKMGLSSNPDDPRHYYDYRKLYKEKGGFFPDKAGHLPSKYKKEGHPRMYVEGVKTK
jgi:hypothetical protein